MTKKTTRKELLKSPDEFLTFSARVALWATAHQKQLKGVGLLIGSLVVLYLAGWGYFRYVNTKGQEAYNLGYEALSDRSSPQKTQTSPEDLRKADEFFRRAHDDYSLSKASRLAIPQMAYVRLMEKKYDEAISLYTDFLKKVSGDTVYETLAHLGLASCHETKGDLKKAQEALEPILKGPNNPFEETVMLNLVRLYRMDNQQEKARTLSKEFVEKYKTSPFLPMIKAQL